MRPRNAKSPHIQPSAPRARRHGPWRPWNATGPLTSDLRPATSDLCPLAVQFLPSAPPRAISTSFRFSVSVFRCFGVSVLTSVLRLSPFGVSDFQLFSFSGFRSPPSDLRPHRPLPSSHRHVTLAQTMSTLMEIEEAAAQLPSPDFVQLLEDLHDLATARVALGALQEDPTAAISWQKLKRELDVLHG